MSTTVEEVITALNNATNEVAATLTALRLELEHGVPCTENQLAVLDELANRLHAMAADPADVVPVR